MTKNILICGDSFAADWAVKYPNAVGWPNLLSKYYNITNLAQAGCSEYKIFNQLTSVDLNLYDFIIVSHTSPYRIPVKYHPVHFNDPLHKNSDLIYADIKEHSYQDTELNSIVTYFEKYFDPDCAIFTHSLLCQEIDRLLIASNIPYINITHIDWTGLYNFSNLLKFERLFNSNRGTINHYDELGNQAVFLEIKKQIEQ